MDNSAKLIAALVLSCAGTAYAGYAAARPPSSWSPGTYAASANDSVYGRVIHSPNGPTTTVGGQAIKMPAAYRFAANAPRIAAGIIFANPYLRTGAAIAAWLGLASIFWDEVDKVWKKVGEEQIVPDKEYNVSGAGWASTREAACQMLVVSLNSTESLKRFVLGVTETYCQIAFVVNPANISELPFNVRSVPCPTGWTSTPAGCVFGGEPLPLTKEQFEDAVMPMPMPELVPLELPEPSPLPIEYPSPWINPSPGPNPQHQPLFVPTGDPVPNPNYDPNASPGPNNQPYMQPGVRVVPSPTPADPWRVDHQPVYRPQADPTPNPNPEAEPGADPSDKLKPEEQQSLCEKYPDIVACAKLGDPGQATPVPNESKPLSITPENGFGPSNASCPAPRTVQVSGLTLSMPFDLLCDFASGIKPFIVGLAWLTAAFSFMGIGRRS